MNVNQQQQQQQFQFQHQQQQQIKPPASLRTRPISAGGGVQRFAPMSSKEQENKQSVNQWSRGAPSNNQYSNKYAGGSTFSFGQADIEGQQQQQPEQSGVNSETYRQETDDYGMRITNLEREIRSKSFEIKDLKEKLSFYQANQNLGTGVNGELEQIRRDKSIACGLVNTMQKDLSNKDATICKLTRDIDVLKRQVTERETSMTELEEKMKSLNDAKKQDGERENKEKELTVANAVRYFCVYVCLV